MGFIDTIVVLADTDDAGRLPMQYPSASLICRIFVPNTTKIVGKNQALKTENVAQWHSTLS